MCRLNSRKYVPVANPWYTNAFLFHTFNKLIRSETLAKKHMAYMLLAKIFAACRKWKCKSISIVHQANSPCHGHP